MVLISWFREIRRGRISESDHIIPAIPDNFRKWLLDLLACSDPAFPTKDSLLAYSELSRTYAKMRNEASHLFCGLESSGKFASLLSALKIDPDNLSADDSINFASKLPSFCNEAEGQTERHILDDLESAKQRLLTTSSYLKCVQVRIVLASSLIYLDMITVVIYLRILIYFQMSG